MNQSRIYTDALEDGVRNNAGKMMRVQMRVKASPTVSSIPMLAVPWCDENIRLAKSTRAVKAL